MTKPYGADSTGHSPFPKAAFAAPPQALEEERTAAAPPEPPKEELPSHALLVDGVATLVHPAGHDPAELVKLPTGFWDAPRRWDGEGWVVDWGPLHAELLARINREAGEFRARFITEIPGQQMTYLDKEAQARGLVAGGDPAAAPMIVGEAKVRGLKLEQMAALVIGRADELRALGALIEVRRVAAGAAVLAASTVEEKRAASVVDWQALFGGEG